MRRKNRSTLLPLWLCLLVGFPAAVLADTTPTPADFARLQAEVSRLAQEQREQKQLLLNLMQADQQRYDLLLQLVRSGGAAGLPAPSVAVAAPPLPSAPPAPEVVAGGGVGVVAGRVTVNGASPGEAWIYVDGIKGGIGRPRSVEIRQKDKQFSPPVLVVPTGTRVTFPNADTVFHNVFSRSPGNAFDAGSIKAGQESPPVVMSRPGHVEIFCNIHSRMRADLLVVPNGYFTKVNGDGSFQLPGVPVGARKLVLWGPGLKSSQHRVEVTARGAQIAIAADRDAVHPHVNKFGQAYGSYDE